MILGCGLKPCVTSSYNEEKSGGGGMKKQGRGRETVGDCQRHKNSGKNIQFRVWCRLCMVPIGPWRLSRPGSRAFLSYCSTSMISRGLLTRASFIPGCLSPQHLRSRWSQTPECQGSWSLLTSRLYGKLEAPWLSLLASELLMFSSLMSLQVN